jgi:GNAT superfamily N-acetyltransferase
LADIRLARKDDAARVRDVMLLAFEEYRAFPLPSSALDESLADIERAMSRGGALIATDGERDVGSVRFEIAGGTLTFARLAVVPDARGHGLGAAIIARLESMAASLGLGAVEITVRSQQPDNRPYYERRGYEITGYGERYGVADLVTKMRKVLARD